MSRISSLLRRTFGVVKEHVGTDHFGNKYYIIPEQKTWTGRVSRAKRTVEPANPNEYQYSEGHIPAEWDAWIRGRRNQPPTIEELVKNQRYREDIKLKAKQAEEKDLALQAKEYGEGLVARPNPTVASTTTVAKGHAAATAFGKAEVSEEPISSGGSFQPGSWMPPSSKK